MTMRLKPVPEPPTAIGRVETVQSALPLVPGSEDDCCARIVRRTDVASRDEAKRWITFLRALDLAAEHDSGYARERTDPDRAAMATAFREGVFGASEVLAALAAAADPLDAPEVLDRIEDVVPRWERNRGRDWRRDWTDRVGRLLDWAVLFGLAERTDAGYRAVADGATAPEPTRDGGENA